MTMTRDEIIAWAQEFLSDKGSPTALNDFYDEVIYSFARSTYPPLVEIELFDYVSGQREYGLTDRATELLAVFFEGYELYPAAGINELADYDASFRSTAGDPFAFTKEEEGARKFSVYPVPAVSTKASTDPSTPLGDGFPQDGGAQMFGVREEDHIPEYLALELLFRLLALETAYPSDHRDDRFSAVCSQLVKLFQWIR